MAVVVDAQTLFARFFDFDDQTASVVGINVAGLPVGLLFDNPAVAEQARRDYAPFLSDDEPLTRVRIHVDERVYLGDDLEIGEVGPAIDETVEQVIVAWRGYVLVADKTWRNPRVVLRSGCGAVENVLRIIYSFLILEHDGFLLHSSGVERDGAGIVFFGKSGSGKTTAARLSAPYQVLSDDMIAITRRNGGFVAWGTPFGEVDKAGRQNRSTPLRGLFLLKQSPEMSVEPLARREFVTHLMANVVTFTSDLDRQATILDLCRALSLKIDGAMLHFRRDPSFWEVIVNAP